MTEQGLWKGILLGIGTWLGAGVGIIVLRVAMNPDWLPGLILAWIMYLALAGLVVFLVTLFGAG